MKIPNIFNLRSALIFFLLGSIYPIARYYGGYSKELAIELFVLISFFIAGGVIGRLISKYDSHKQFSIIIGSLIAFFIGDKYPEWIQFLFFSIILIVVLEGAFNSNNPYLIRSLFRKIGFPGFVLWLFGAGIASLCFYNILPICNGGLGDFFYLLGLAIILIGFTTFGFLWWIMETVRDFIKGK